MYKYTKNQNPIIYKDTQKLSSWAHYIHYGVIFLYKIVLVDNNYLANKIITFTPTLYGAIKYFY